MTYYIHRYGVIKKTLLRILNVFLVVMIPIEAYYWMMEFGDSYVKSFKEEIKTWKEGFKFGD